MNKEEKGAGNFRKRMAEYREPAPENLWAELEKELNRPKIVPIYRRYAAVAAVVTVAVLSSAVLWWINSSSTEYVKEISNTIAEVKPVQISKPDVPSVDKEKEFVMKQHLSDRKLIAKAEKEESEYMPLVATVSANEEQPQETEPTVEKTVNKEEKLHEEKNSSRKSAPSVRRSFYDASSDNYRNFAGKKKKGGWEISVAVGNTPNVSRQGSGYTSLQGRKVTMIASIAEFGQPLIEPMTPIAGAYNQLVANNVDKEVQSKAEHKMPITTGISVRKNLTDRWAIESGITYTLLSSELWSGTEHNYYETEQKLHYIGIPLKGIYRLWENNLFSVYVSAGGAVEKCVSGKQNTVCTIDGVDKGVERNDVKVDELQWSVFSAVGAQVKLLKNFGVYLEPGINYYFKDGSDIQTVRKEHPLNFNLQMGVRFSF